MTKGRQARKGRGNPGIFQDLKEMVGISNKKRSNLTERDAENLAEEFHGRKPRTKIEIAEREHYFGKLAILGELEELGILQDDDTHILPIRFKPGKLIGTSTGDSEDCVWLCAANNHQLELVDGDQELDFNAEICRKLGLDPEELDKQYIKVGPIYSIVYFADKHHLEGPKYQEKGTSYQHEFGTEGANDKLPDLFYDTLNDKCLIVGGGYTIESEGIKG